TIGEALKQKEVAHTLVVSSTVLPGTCRDVIAPRVGKNCQVIFNPVWLALGSVIKDYLNPPVVVLGSDSTIEMDLLNFFSNLFNQERKQLLVTDSLTAEALKIEYNVWCTNKMAFVNRTAGVFKRIGADASVLERFFKQGGEQPGRFMRPGAPFGGPCFPRDVRFAKYVSPDDSLLRSIQEINEGGYLDILLTVSLIARKSSGPTKVGVAGLTYKPGVPVVEESSSATLIQKLKQVLPSTGPGGDAILAYDPLINEGIEGVDFCGSLQELIDRSTILIEMHEGMVPAEVRIPVIRPWR
ncbi:hypothetical protein LCGC14_1689010, partial [marine sediment metagenome]